MGKELSAVEREELVKELRVEREAKYSDRIKALLLIDDGCSYEEVSYYLFMHENSIRNYVKRYKSGGIEELVDDDYSGSECRLTRDQQGKLEQHLEEEVCSDSKMILHYIEKEFGVKYSVSGVITLLKRLGFVYKKTKIIPGKAQISKQEDFVKELQVMLKSTEIPVYFGDGVHPQHNTRAANGWIKRGTDKEIKANTGRERININGVVNAIDPTDVIVRTDDTLDADSTIKLLQQVEDKNPAAKEIIVIVDNARYYKCYKVKDFLVGSRIKLVFLPSYSPNLNIIERLWKFMYKKVLNNKYYEKFKDFQNAVLGFFDRINEYKNELQTLLALNFRCLGT